MDGTYELESFVIIRCTCDAVCLWKHMNNVSNLLLSVISLWTGFQMPSGSKLLVPMQQRTTTRTTFVHVRYNNSQVLTQSTCIADTIGTKLKWKFFSHSSVAIWDSLLKIAFMAADETVLMSRIHYNCKVNCMLPDSCWFQQTHTDIDHLPDKLVASSIVTKMLEQGEVFGCSIYPPLAKHTHCVVYNGTAVYHTLILCR